MKFWRTLSILTALVLLANFFVPQWLHMLIGIYLGGFFYYKMRD